MFNNEQQKIIFDIIQRYNNDQEYRNNIEISYNTEPIELSIFEIYVLEEIIRYGCKNYYNDLLKTKQNDNQDILKEYEMLVNLYKSNEEFLMNEYEKYEKNKEVLSQIQIYVIRMFMKNKRETKNEKMDSDFNFEYDDFTEIKYATDNQIKDTLLNILLGNYIYELLNNETVLKSIPDLVDVKSHQKEPGMIANSDKKIIINLIQSNFPDVTMIEMMENKVNEMYLKVKMELLIKNSGEKAFETYITQRTNITNDEVGFDLYKDMFTKDDIAKIFNEYINNTKNSDSTYEGSIFDLTKRRK